MMSRNSENTYNSRIKNNINNNKYLLPFSSALNSTENTCSYYQKQSQQVNDNYKTDSNVSLCHTINEIDCYFKQNLLLSGNERNCKNSQTFVIYENLCENCGFAFTITKENQLQCDFCDVDCRLLNSNLSSESLENIYENICELCGLIFSGDKCLECLKNEKSEKSKQINIFSGLLETIRLRKSREKSAVKKSRHIEIIHNVGADVFKTNKTFDLNEICRMRKKSAPALLAATSDRHIYGKLRQSDESLDHKLAKFVEPTKSPLSDSIFNKYFLNNKLTQSHSDYLPAKSTAQRASYNNNYENLDKIIYSTISPVKIVVGSARKYDDIIKTTYTKANSLINWMTSLKKHTEDYNEENVYNIKCIPSNSFDDSVYVRRGRKKSCNLPIAISARRVSDFVQQIQKFQNNIMDLQSKRQAIYVRENLFIDHITDRDECISETCNCKPDILRSERDSYEISDTFLRPKNRCYYCQSVQQTDQQSVAIVTAKTTLDPFYKHKKRKLNLKKIIFINNLCVSISLNKLLITYDNVEQTIPLTFLLSKCDNVSDQLKLKEKYLQFLIKLKKPIIHQADNNNSITTRSKTNLNDFIVVQFNEFAFKKEIEDFERKFPASEISRRLEDFEKSNGQPSNKLKKILTDYELKIKTPRLSAEKMTTLESDKVIPPIEEENIYQQIWNCKTIGHAKEDDSNDIYYDSNVSVEDVDINEWEVAEEFRYSTEFRQEHYIELLSHCPAPSTMLTPPSSPPPPPPPPPAIRFSPYESVCIFYDLKDPKLNRIFYEYDNKLPKITIDTDDLRWRHLISSSPILPKNTTTDTIIDKPIILTNQKSSEIVPDSVKAWKLMMLHVSYGEDEEDVNLPEEFYFDQILDSQKQQDFIESTYSSSSSSSNLYLNNNYNKNDLNAQPKSVTFISKSSDSLLTSSSASPKKDGFLDKFQRSKIEIAKISKNFVTNDTPLHGVYKRNVEGVEFKRSKIKDLVYGIDLDEVEKDEKNPNVPKFVVECIKIIELEENLITNGLYRASGKKESIDKIKKKMNDNKLRKGHKYKCLDADDVHTVTGALKQFFRELKTDLIPIDIFKNLPNDLENDESLRIIKSEFNQIPLQTKDTLKYLLRHLIKVDQHSGHNLMNASNLSIVWGACIFTSSVSMLDTFETSELIKKNTLIRILIQKYDEIFD